MDSSTLKVARLVLYFAWTLALMPVQWIGLALGCRWVSTLPTFYHRRCCRLLGFRVRAIGRPTTQRPVLFAANHISYTDITILGSPDNSDWSGKPVLSFPQKFYCGTYQLLFDLNHYPDVKFIRAKWQVSRWGRGDPKPLFGVYLFIQDASKRAMAKTA